MSSLFQTRTSVLFAEKNNLYSKSCFYKQLPNRQPRYEIQLSFLTVSLTCNLICDTVL